MKESNSTEEKESAIAVCLTQLSRAHIFHDGNTRSVNILLIGLLLSNDLKPSVLFDPNCFDKYADSEILQALQRGRLNFQALLKEDSPEYVQRTALLNDEPELLNKPSIQWP